MGGGIADSTPLSGPVPSQAVTYCRGGPTRSPCRARTTGTIWRNSSTGKRRDPSPPRSTAGSWQPGRRPPVSGSGSSGGPEQPTPGAAAAAAPPHGALSACPVCLPVCLSAARRGATGGCLQPAELQHKDWSGGAADRRSAAASAALFMRRRRRHWPVRPAH